MTVTHAVTHPGAQDYLHHMLRSLRLARPAARLVTPPGHLARTHRPLQRRRLGTVAAAAGGVGAATTTAFAFDFMCTAPPVLCEDKPGGVRKLSEHALSLQRQKAKNAELVAAAISGDAAAITGHIAQGADPDSCDDGTEWGVPALGKAAYHGHRAAVEALLEGGARVDKPDIDGWTALMFAATWGKSDCLLALLLNNASMTAKNRGGLTALDQAKLMSRRGSTTSTRHRKSIECVAVLEAWAAGMRDPAALEAVLTAASCMELSKTKKKNLVLARDLGAGRPP